MIEQGAGLLLEKGTLGLVALIALYVAYRLGTLLVSEIQEGRARDESKNQQIITGKDQSSERERASADRQSALFEKQADVLGAFRSDVSALASDIKGMRDELARFTANYRDR